MKKIMIFSYLLLTITFCCSGSLVDNTFAVEIETLIVDNYCKYCTLIFVIIEDSKTGFTYSDFIEGYPGSVAFFDIPATYYNLYASCLEGDAEGYAWDKYILVSYSGGMGYHTLLFCNDFQPSSTTTSIDYWYDTTTTSIDYWGTTTTTSIDYWDITTTTSYYDDEDCLLEEIYGEYSEETELLRYFRDNVLTQTQISQEIINLYYQWSPVIVEAMEENEEFKEELKEVIDGVLGWLRKRQST